jgi:hypothetical protein
MTQPRVAKPKRSVSRKAPKPPASSISHEDVRRLAHSYWEARGRQGGSPEEDWLRAEEELQKRRAGTPS